MIKRILLSIIIPIVLLFGCDNPLQTIIDQDIHAKFPTLLLKQGDTEIPNGGTYTYTGVSEGYSIQVEFTIENNGQAELMLTGGERIEITGDEAFSLVSSQPNFSIQPGESVFFTIQFSPPDREIRTAKISIACNDPDKQDYNFTLYGSGGVITVTGVSLNTNSITTAFGYPKQLTATIVPSNAFDQNVTWESSTESVATVDSMGLVTPVALGTTAITVTTREGGFTDTCTVFVEDLWTISQTGTVGNVGSSICQFSRN